MSTETEVLANPTNDERPAIHLALAWAFEISGSNDPDNLNLQDFESEVLVPTLYPELFSQSDNVRDLRHYAAISAYQSRLEYALSCLLQQRQLEPRTVAATRRLLGWGAVSEATKLEASNVVSLSPSRAPTAPLRRTQSFATVSYLHGISG